MIRRSPLSLRWAIGATVFVATVFLLYTGRHHSYKSHYESILKSVQHDKLADDVYNSTLGASNMFPILAADVVLRFWTNLAREQQFQKIFVVGLPSRTDRRDNMQLQASISGLEIEFIDGVKGGDVSEKAVPTNEDGVQLSPAGIGSWRAHMNAVHEYVKSPPFFFPCFALLVFFLYSSADCHVRKELCAET